MSKGLALSGNYPIISDIGDLTTSCFSLRSSQAGRGAGDANTQ